MQPEGYIYAIRADNLVKLGWSRQPCLRFSKIQSDNAVACDLLGCIAGDEAAEAALHVRFGRHRVRGEWFAWSDEIAEFVATMGPPPTKAREYVSPLQEWRGERSLREVGDAVGASPAQLSRVENGKRYPSLDLMLRLRALTGLSLDAIAAPFAEPELTARTA